MFVPMKKRVRVMSPVRKKPFSLDSIPIPSPRTFNEPIIKTLSKLDLADSECPFYEFIGDKYKETLKKVLNIK